MSGSAVCVCVCVYVQYAVCMFMRRCRFRTLDHPIDPHICDMVTHVYDGGNESAVTST